MLSQEKEWWKTNKELVYSVKSYEYLKLLLDGQKLFSWSVERLDFLKQWWWKKFGKEVKENLRKSLTQETLF